MRGWTGFDIVSAKFLESRSQFFTAVGFLDVFHFDACQGIAPLVLRVSGMALEPIPVEAVRLASGVEGSPEVVIFYRLTLGGHPAFLTPRVDPLCDAHAKILGVGENDHFAGFLERLESRNRSA